MPISESNHKAKRIILGISHQLHGCAQFALHNQLVPKILILIPGVPSLMIFQKSADFEMSNLAKSDFSVSNLIFEMQNFVNFTRNIMEN